MLSSGSKRTNGSARFFDSSGVRGRALSDRIPLTSELSEHKLTMLVLDISVRLWGMRVLGAVMVFMLDVLAVRIFLVDDEVVAFLIPAAAAAAPLLEVIALVESLGFAI